MELTEKTVSSQTIYSGRIINVELHDVLLPNGKNAKREIVRHSEAVAVLAVDEDNNVYLVEQFRKPIDSPILEIPAGHVEKGEDPKETAIRELQEEIGMSAGKMTLINKYYTSPGFTDELIYFFLAENLTESRLSADDDEFINVKKIPFDRFLQMVKDNTVTDVKAILAAYFYAAFKMK